MDFPKESQIYPYTFTACNASSQYNYNQRFTQNRYRKYQPEFKPHKTKLNRRVPQNTTKDRPQNRAPLPLWTPELYPDPETGEMNSIPGAAQVYSNGHTYPNTQIYVDTQVARNMPSDRQRWDPNELSPSDLKLETIPKSVDFEQSNLSPIQWHSTRYMENEYNWPLVYEIYGTSIGIILKCMSNDLTTQGYHYSTDLFRQDKWLQEQGLPYPTTRWILDRYYFAIPFFHQVGERVQIGVRKRRELKEKIKVGLDAGMWPGDTDFSELRNSCEIIRRKALEFLESWGGIFEKEWAALRQRRDWYYYHQ
jgi:hypothetical protein